jgi:uncharacterized membrane protein
MKYPLKTSIKTELIPGIITAASLLFGIYFYIHFPQVVVGHWNFVGEPNGYLSKFWGAFALPLVIIGVYFLFFILPILDPLQERYTSFSKAYQFIRNAVLIALFIIFITGGAYNLGYPVKIGMVVPVVIGLMLLAVGNHLGQIKPNWFVGIRTPWTLSSERVWNKTHKIGGRMFILFGILLVIIPFLPQALGISFFILGIVLLIAVPIVYSYILYKEETK